MMTRLGKNAKAKLKPYRRIEKSIWKKKKQDKTELSKLIQDINQILLKKAKPDLTMLFKKMQPLTKRTIAVEPIKKQKSSLKP